MTWGSQLRQVIPPSGERGGQAWERERNGPQRNEKPQEEDQLPVKTGNREYALSGKGKSILSDEEGGKRGKTFL